MLVLTRKPFTGWDKIVIADGLITITLVQVDGNAVRIGIDAPADISVDREEVFLRKVSEDAAAANMEEAQVPLAAEQTVAVSSEVRGRRRRPRFR